MIFTQLTPSHTFRPALFLDWDGTIRQSRSGATFIKDEFDIELIPGVEEAILNYRNKGFVIVGITNQGGVSYGYKTQEQINREVKATIDLFKENPFHIIEVCLFMPGGTIEPYRHRSLLRKPDYGMLVLAEYQAFSKGILFDYRNSLFVGDRPEDQDCAHKAGIAFMPADMFLKPHPITIVVGDQDRKFNEDFQRYEDELYNLSWDQAKELIRVDEYGAKRKAWSADDGVVIKSANGLYNKTGSGYSFPVLYLPSAADDETNDWYLIKL